MYSSESDSKGTNDNILRHFILVGLVLVDAILKISNLLISSRRKDKKSSNTQNDTNDVSKGKEDLIEIERRTQLLSTKSKQELKELLNNVDIISSFTKTQLTTLILSNKDAIRQLVEEEKKASLYKLTNKDLRNLLKSVPSKGRLKKSELVELLLEQEQV